MYPRIYIYTLLTWQIIIGRTYRNLSHIHSFMWYNYYIYNIDKPRVSKMKIVLGVTGGIAAYKLCSFCSLASKEDHQIQVVQTANSTKFIGSLTFEGLTNRPVLLDTFAHAMDHITYAKWADIVIIAPLSANMLAKIAHGLADDLLSTTILAVPAQTPILLCPAMNTEMWNNPITQRNIQILQESKRFHWLYPVEKRLACGDIGIGGLVEPEHILEKAKELCAQ